MSAKAMKKGLGRSFSSLIPSELLDESFDPTAAQDEKISDLRHIKLSEIIADPTQPRRFFDETALDEMSASIVQHGVLQPIVVTPHKGKYQIVAGERRWRASQKAGLDKIPALVRTLSDQHKLELSLIENLQRRDLNPLETATAYLKLRDQFNLNLDEIGRRVGGKSVSAVSNSLRLLRLPDNVRSYLADGTLTEGQVRPLIGLEPGIIDQVLPLIVQQEWSARRIEQFVVHLKNGKKPEKTVQALATDAHEAEIARISKRLQAGVKIRTNAKGAGQIVIAFKNADEFSRLQQLLTSEK